MERMEIKLKECCLECEYFMPDGYMGLCSSKREISCSHMPVCYKYSGVTSINQLKQVALKLLNAYEYHTRSLRSIFNQNVVNSDEVCAEIIAGREENAKEYRREIENA